MRLVDKIAMGAQVVRQRARDLFVDAPVELGLSEIRLHNGNQETGIFSHGVRSSSPRWGAGIPHLFRAAPKDLPVRDYDYVGQGRENRVELRSPEVGVVSSPSAAGCNELPVLVQPAAMRSASDDTLLCHFIIE